VTPVTGGPPPVARGGASAGEDNPEKAPHNRLLFELAGLDLSRRLVPREGIERLNPHRGAMSLLDWIVWNTPDYTRGVGLMQVREDQFWVAGHFPGRPMLPGVLMVEAGAQMACYLYNIRRPQPKVIAFLRIEDCAFRSMVTPGDDLHILANEIKIGRRRFISDVQGVVGNDRIAFDARVTGMQLDE